MNRLMNWTYSVSWFERVEQDRRIMFAEPFDFDNELLAVSKWRRAKELHWVAATYEDPDVSALVRVEWFVTEDGVRSGQPRRTIVHEQDERAA